MTPEFTPAIDSTSSGRDNWSLIGTGVFPRRVQIYKIRVEKLANDIGNSVFVEWADKANLSQKYGSLPGSCIFWLAGSA
jgi:hypothetical protein